MITFKIVLFIEGLDKTEEKKLNYLLEGCLLKNI